MECVNALSAARFARFGRGQVAVGTVIAGRPPHRSVRALLTHTAPIFDEWHQSAHSDKDAGHADGAAIFRTNGSGFPTSAGAFDCDGVRRAATSGTDGTGKCPDWRDCPERRNTGNIRRRLASATRQSGQPAHAYVPAASAELPAISPGDVCPPFGARP